MASPPAILSTLPLFRSIPQQDLEAIYQAARRSRASEGEILFHQGDEAEHLWLVVAGRVRLFQVTPEGEQVILHIAGPGEALAIVAVLSHFPYPVSAQAMETCTLLRWQADQMHAFMLRYPRLALNAVDILAGHIRTFQDRIRELATERVERRIAHTLLRLARQVGRRTPEGVLLDLPLTRQDLAEMCGTTLYTVSRTLKAWEQAGILVTGRARVVIRTPHQLVAIAEDLPAPDKKPD